MQIKGKSVQYHYDICEEFIKKNEFYLEKYFKETYNTTDMKTVFEVNRGIEYSTGSIIEELLSLDYIISRCSVNLYVDGKKISTIFASFDEIRHIKNTIEVVQKITIHSELAEFLDNLNKMPS